MDQTTATEWRVMFNFFVKAEAPTGYATFMECFWDTGNYVRSLEPFGVSQMHRNLDPEGLYKYINYAGFDSDDFAGFQFPPTGEWLEHMKKCRAGNAIESYPGGYREIGTADSCPWAPVLAKSDDSVFLISSFKVADETDSTLQDFQNNWMAVSGAQFITENVPNPITIANIGIYRRFTKIKHITYVLRAELTGVGSDLTEAWNLVNKVRANSRPELFTEINTSLYKIMPETVVFNEKKFNPASK